MNKASGGDGIPPELFRIIDNDAIKVLQSICQQIWKTQQWPKDWTRSAFIHLKEGQCQRMFKLHTIALISYASKVAQTI